MRDNADTGKRNIDPRGPASIDPGHCGCTEVHVCTLSVALAPAPSVACACCCLRCLRVLLHLPAVVPLAIIGLLATDFLGAELILPLLVMARYRSTRKALRRFFIIMSYLEPHRCARTHHSPQSSFNGEHNKERNPARHEKHEATNQRRSSDICERSCCGVIVQEKAVERCFCAVR